MAADSEVGEGEGASKVNCTDNSSSTSFDGGLDGITVVGCSAEGSVAIPQTVCTNSDSGNTTSIHISIPTTLIDDIIAIVCTMEGYL